MLKGPPSALRLPNYKKQETIAAVNTVFNLLGQQMAQRDRLVEIDWANGMLALRSIRDSMDVFSTYVQFIVGRSQQRRIKRHIRRWDVELESQRTARETSRNYKEISELFMSLMNDYIDPN